MAKRTKILLVLSVAVVAAAALIYPLTHLAYKSVGIIEIGKWAGLPDGSAPYPSPIGPPLSDGMTLMFKNESLFRAAMEDQAWKKHRKLPPDAYLAEWQKSVVVQLEPYSSVIKITYRSNSADARAIAPIAVSALIRAYQRLNVQPEVDALQRKIDLWGAHDRALSAKIRTDGTTVAEMLIAVGDNPQIVLEHMYESHFVLQKQVRDLDEQIRIERGDAVAANILAAKEKSLEELQDKFAVEEQDLQDFGLRAHEIAVLRTEKQRYEEEQIRVEKKIEELQHEKGVIGAFKVIDYGSKAQVAAEFR